MARELTRWDPLSRADAWRTELDRLFDRWNLWTNPLPRAWSEMDWAPPLDVEETDSQLIVRTELPGMRREDIKVSGTNDSLCISGERRFDGEGTKKNYQRIERAYGKFQRCLTLPSDVDWDKTKAVYRDGILELTLTKSAKSKARQITVQA